MQTNEKIKRIPEPSTECVPLRTEYVPSWLYYNGKRLAEDVWEFNGIQYKIQRKKETSGKSLRIVPLRMIDKLRCLFGRVCK